MPRFEVHSHTCYSNLRLLDSTNKPENLIDRAIELGLSGIAITDHEALCSHIKCNQYQKIIAKKYPDFKIALGNEIYLIDSREEIEKYFHFILIAKNSIGYTIIKELSSIAWLNMFVSRGMERVPTLKSDLINLLDKYGRGHLIATSACLGGELSTLAKSLCEAEEPNQAIQYKTKINEFINFCKYCFGDDFYIECAPGCSEDQIMVNKRLAAIAKFYKVKMVIGTDAHFLSKEDRYVHKAYLNSQGGEREVDAFYEFSYLQNEEELYLNLTNSFDKNFIDDLIANSEEIYLKIQRFSLENKQRIPKVAVKNYEKTMSYFGVNNDIADLSLPTLRQLLISDEIQERYWVNECLTALIQKGLFNDEYLLRLETEADIIKHIGGQLEDCLFAYFNTFKHYIDLFWDCDSIVGPGRGSATGFLSNYLLGITQLDPIRWGLPEWRFLNKERAELPSLLLILGSCKKRVLTIA